MVYLLAGMLTFPITAAFTIAGVGAAFVLIPVFTTLGIELHQAMAVALLLNALAMISASVRYTKKKLVLWKLSIPLIISTAIGAPIGVKIGYNINNVIIRIIFVCFLLFAAGMIFFSRTKNENDGGMLVLTTGKSILSGFAGLGVGMLAGLIGVGGGNIILPILIAFGIKPREAVGTTALVVVFSSVSAFLSHVGISTLDWLLIGITAGAAIAGAIVGSWLMTDKLNPKAIKKVLGFVLIAFAIKMIIGLI
ncbi:MAG: sulfite exporter TauE/SafE family protein [Spirochaetales bacterium]|jgi:uncharacterized protein|nr:sulfite exporter TauE/SafE family protein [Spirochaetales bacterium]